MSRIIGRPGRRLGAALLVLLALLLAGCGGRDTDKLSFGGNDIVESGDVVDGDLAVFGGNLIVEHGARVTGDAIVFGGNLDILGDVEGDLAVMGGNATVHGTIGGDATVFGGNLYRARGSIGGDTHVYGGNVQDLEGEIVELPTGPESPVPPEPEIVAPPVVPEIEIPVERAQERVASGSRGVFGWVVAIITGILQVIALGVIGLAVTLFLPEHVRRVGSAAGSAPAASTAVGCLALPAMLFGMLLLVITVIGIPIALLLPPVLFAAGIFGWIGIGYFVGDRMLRSADIRSPRPAAAAAIGAATLLLIGKSAGALVPFFGDMVIPVVGLWALGAAILTRGGTQPYPRRLVTAGAARPPVAPAYDPLDELLEPRPRRRPPAAGTSGRRLFDDLAADLGIADELDDDETPPDAPERPVPPDA